MIESSNTKNILAELTNNDMTYSISRAKGFTLIELLIVVLIIAILAAIALPNFLEFQTRAKTSRAKADMRSVATAIEAYAVDYGTYPNKHTYHPDDGFHNLTTPIAYISRVPHDAFATAGIIDGRDGIRHSAPAGYDPIPYDMGAGSLKGWDVWPKNSWVLVSYGPDVNDDTHLTGEFPLTKIACPYDPTNGSVSNGDIYRMATPEDLLNFKSDANPMFN